MSKTIIRITTVPMAFKVLLAGQPRFMSENGFNVIIVSADGREVEDVKKAEGCQYLIVPMTRKITPFRDITSFLKLRQLIKKYNPDIVHTHTPKAGLLGMLAALSAGVKIRIHTVAGLPLMLETGWKRQLLMLTEKVTYLAATAVWPNSLSMKNFILEKKLAKAKKLLVIGNGSSNGVDLNKFSTETLNEDIKNEVKKSLPQFDGLKILCVGRMVQDKGIDELITVFQKLQKHYTLQLILVGPFEPELDPLSPGIMDSIKNNADITHINWSDAVEYYMSMADILVHPSHREGFPNVILQAGAMQLPVICSNIPGNVDIIQNDALGLIFEARDENDLYRKLKFAIENKEAIKKRAQTFFEEITRLYDRKKIQGLILNTYKNLLHTDEIK